MKLLKFSLVLILAAPALAKTDASPVQHETSPSDASPQPSKPDNATPSDNPAPGIGKESKPKQQNATTGNKQTTNDYGGTEKVPLVITSIPTEKATEQAKEDRKERDAKMANERGLTLYTGLLALFTFGLIVVGSIQLGLFFWQLRLIKKGTYDAKTAADAATIGAAAARDSADIAKLSMVAAGRAYVHYNGCRWTSHKDIANEQIFWRIRPRLINSGNTPTRGLRIFNHCELRDSELPQDHKFAPDVTVEISGTIYPKGQIESGAWDVRGTDLVTISQGQKHLYVWGIAMYRDVFPDTPQHITKFCAFARNISGDPLLQWHADDNPLEILFTNYQRHNCADEDCDEKE